MRRLLKFLNLALILAFMAVGQARSIELQKIESPVRLNSLERLAVLNGIKTVMEIRDREDSVILWNVESGRKGDLVFVCGYCDMQDSSGRYYGGAPFAGFFVPSAAAFIKKTFVPYLWRAPSKFDEVFKACRDIDLAID